MYNFTPEEKLYFDQLAQGVEDIRAHPKHWDQRHWHCGTSHCLAGFCDIRRDNDGKLDLSKDWDLTNESSFAEAYPYWGEEAEIFSGINTLDDICKYLEHIRENGFRYNMAGFDDDGYDRDGYDRSGYTY